MIEAICFDLGDTLVAEETVIHNSCGRPVALLVQYEGRFLLLPLFCHPLQLPDLLQGAASVGVQLPVSSGSMRPCWAKARNALGAACR